jgi:hypothetical protein
MTTFVVAVPIYLILDMHANSALLVGLGAALGAGLGAPAGRKRRGSWRQRIAARFGKSP